MRYELFYGSGGHGGPYSNLGTAVTAAIDKLHGSRTERRIDVCPRTVDSPNGFGPCEVRFMKAGNGAISQSSCTASTGECLCPACWVDDLETITEAI